MPKILPDTDYVATVILQHIYFHWNIEEGKTIQIVFNPMFDLCKNSLDH